MKKMWMLLLLAGWLLSACGGGNTGGGGGPVGIDPTATPVTNSTVGCYERVFGECRALRGVEECQGIAMLTCGEEQP